MRNGTASVPFFYWRSGDPTRTRTWDPMVKSHLLYRLSYRTTKRGYDTLPKQAFYNLSRVQIKLHTDIDALIGGSGIPERFDETVFAVKP